MVSTEWVSLLKWNWVYAKYGYVLTYAIFYGSDGSRYAKYEVKFILAFSLSYPSIPAPHPCVFIKHKTLPLQLGSFWFCILAHRMKCTENNNHMLQNMV